MPSDGANLDDPFSLVGETLAGRFRIEGAVAEGGFGVVYRARQLVLDRAVAIKVLKTPADLTGDQRTTFARTFEAEAQTIARLKHPHIVEVHDFGVTSRASKSTSAPGEPLHWMALEWLEGMTLETFLAQRGAAGKPPLQPAEALELLRPVFQAMAFAHAERVVHRDLKPANVFLVERQGAVFPKVVDFGIAKMMGGDPASDPSGSRTTRGLPAFTPDHAAPEQISYGRTGPWTDVHALGLILTEVLTGRPPYADVGGDLFSAVLSQRRPTPGARGVAVAAWEPVLARALSLRPADRQASAGALLEELEGAGVAATVPGPAGRTLSVKPAMSWRRGFARMTTMLALLGAMAAITWIVRRPARRNAGPPRLMLAVLPFEDLSGDARQEYFAEGLTEGMIGQLGRLAPERLAVIARTSVVQYRHTRKSVREIGRELGVQYILEASVQRAPGRVRIEARLVSADDQAQIWSDSYDREIKDVLALQSEVARDIAAGVRLKLSPDQVADLSSTRSLNPAAYDAYLRGRYFLDRWSWDQAFAEFERAIQLDPGYAAAHAALAGIYERRLTGGYSPAVLAKAKAAATRALELDDHLASAHAVLASILFGHDWDWAGAATHFRRAFELDPNDPDAHLRHCWYVRTLGRWPETITACRQALELNPFDVSANQALCSTYYNSRRYDDATRQCQRTSQLDPALSRPHMLLALILTEKGQYAQALTEAALTEAAKFPYPWLTGYIHARAGQPAQALAALERLKEMAPTEFVSAPDLAKVYAALGDRDEAFHWLEKGYRDHDYAMTDLREDSLLAPLRNDPRFADLIRRVGIPGP